MKIKKINEKEKNKFNYFSPQQSKNMNTINFSETTLKNNDLISDKMKAKIVDFMKKTNDYKENGRPLSTMNNPNSSSQNFNTIGNKTNGFKNTLYQEFKILDKNPHNKRNAVNNNISLDKNQANNLTTLANWDDSPNKKNQYTKKEIVSLLTIHNETSSARDTHKFNRLKLIQNEDNGMSNNRKNMTSLYMDTEKFPRDIVSKMKKKFPDLVKPESFINQNPQKNYLENAKINKMKNKINKMFD